MNKQLEQKYLKLYQSLNPQQQKAVDAIEGPVLVLAGPGTGKTTAITVRIAKILAETQIDPQNILCLTFTDTAANHMRSKLINLIGKSAYYINIYTFHGFCNEVIKTYSDKFQNLGYQAEQLSEIEKVQILKTIFDDLDVDSLLKPFGDQETYISEVAKIISNLKREAITPDKYLAAVKQQADFFSKNSTAFIELGKINYRNLSSQLLTSFWQDLQKSTVPDHPIIEYIGTQTSEFLESDEIESKQLTAWRAKLKDIYRKYGDKSLNQKQLEVGKVYQAYQDYLHNNYKYDFDDMVLEVINQFANDEELLLSYQEKFHYILVDEYQDTNNSQNQAVRLLGSYFPNPNIFVVGDDDQAIFRFQGASLQNIYDFYKDYKQDLQLIVFSENYRSAQGILDSAKSVIANNKSKIQNLIADLDKPLISSKLNQGLKSTVQLSVFETPEEESFEVARQIGELVNQGVDPGQIAVIFRKNSDADDLALALQKLGIDFNLKIGEQIFNDVNIQQLFTLLKFVVAPDEDFDFFHLLNFNFLGFKQLDLFKLYRFAYQQRLKVIDLLYQKDQLAAVGLSDQGAAFSLLAEKLSHWQKSAHNNQASDFFNQIIRESGFLDYIITQENYVLLLKKLSRLFSELKRLEGRDQDYRLEKFIDQLQIAQKYRLEMSISVEKSADKLVQLLTAHSAKGLEFEHVFMIKATDKNWGNRSNHDKLKLPIGLTSMSSEDKNEEERRLFYVALTRAKTHLHISYAKNNLEQKPQLASMFVNEIDPALLQINNTPISEQQSSQAYLSYFKPALVDFSVAAKQYLRDILQEFSLSATALLAYQRCPRCFLFTNVLKIPQPASKITALGSAIHLALKQAVITLKQTGQVAEQKYILKVFAESLAAQHLSKNDLQEVLVYGRKILGDFYQIKSKELDKNSLVEFNFAQERIVVDGVPLSGKIDRIDPVAGSNKQIVVVDYKTGNPDSKAKYLSQKNTGDYLKQLIFYKLLAEKSRHKWQVQSGVIEFIERSKKTSELISKSFTITEQQTEQLVSELKDVYQKIRDLQFFECNDKECYTPELHKLNLKL